MVHFRADPRDLFLPLRPGQLGEFIELLAERFARRLVFGVIEPGLEAQTHTVDEQGWVALLAVAAAQGRVHLLECRVDQRLQIRPVGAQALDKGTDRANAHGQPVHDGAVNDQGAGPYIFDVLLRRLHQIGGACLSQNLHRAQNLRKQLRSIVQRLYARGVGGETFERLLDAAQVDAHLAGHHVQQLLVIGFRELGIRNFKSLDHGRFPGVVR